MIIAGYEYRGEKPFTNVYLTGIVRDKQGKKMSKSLGNSPEPLELISKYSADGVRVGMLLSSPAGNDLLFDESLCEQGRNFANKVWNAFRLVKGWEVSDSAQSDSNRTSIEWFESKFNQQLEILNDHYTKYRMSDALMTTYKLIWDDFCAWYLEMIKPEFSEGKSKPIDKATFEATIHFFEKILKVLHPWMPFITEEIWHLLHSRGERDCIIISHWPEIKKTDEAILSRALSFMDTVISIRSVRNEKSISPIEALELHIRTENNSDSRRFESLIKKLCNISAVHYTNSKTDNAASFMVSNVEFYIPLSKNINMEEEKSRLRKDLEYQKGFLQSVQKKLANEKFVQNAKPDILANEKKKEADAMSKIDSIESQLASL
jgi:valyl-tRNA synthetase